MINVTYLGVEYSVPASGSSGMVDVILRGEDTSILKAALIEQGMLVDDGNGLYYTAAGVDITPYWEPSKQDFSDLFSPTITPAVVVDGEVVTPAVIDTRPHLNIRLSDNAVLKESQATPGELQWVETLVLWMLYGDDDPLVNKSESAIKYSSISLVEPESVNTQQRVWL